MAKYSVNNRVIIQISWPLKHPVVLLAKVSLAGQSPVPAQNHPSHGLTSKAASIQQGKQVPDFPVPGACAQRYKPGKEYAFKIVQTGGIADRRSRMVLACQAGGGDDAHRARQDALLAWLGEA